MSSTVCVGCFGGALGFMMHSDGRMPLFHLLSMITTSYVLRPGEDGLPVWMTWVDGARNTKTFFGAVGGYFHLFDGEEFFFFAEQLPEWRVLLADIGQIEMHANTVAARLQRMVKQRDSRWSQAESGEPTSYIFFRREIHSQCLGMY